MSRNVRQKFPAPSRKVTKRRGSDTTESSLSDLSGEEGYSGVDDISDSSDNDEEDVDAAEEEHIVSNELQHPAGSLRPGSDEEGEDVDDDDDDEADDDADNSSESESWNGILSEADNVEASALSPTTFLDEEAIQPERHVRFAGVPDSDSDSTTTETSDDIEEFFPDIFVEQSALDPAFRREIEEDPDDSSNSGTYWDFQGSYNPLAVDSDDYQGHLPGSADDTPTATPGGSQSISDPSTPQNAPPAREYDGYESDGDTTEEDVPEPIVRRKQSRRYASENGSSDSDTDQPVRARRGHPRVGRFNLDSSERKPIAVVNPISRRMMIFTPQRLRRLDLAPESFSMDNYAGLDFQNNLQSSPILSNSASLMLSAMFSSGTFGDFMNTQAVGPAEAFFPFTSDAITGDESDMSEADDEGDEAEHNLQIEDFITFHNEATDNDDEDQENACDEDEEDEEEDEVGDLPWINGTPREPSATPSRKRSTSNASDAVMDDVHPLLNHFAANSDTVGAFRRNQINQQLIFSDKASQESLAFSGPYHHGTLRGIKTDSLEAVATPITPVRRQKRVSFSQVNMGGLEIASPPQSPAQPQKRKASSDHFKGAVNGHKRHRSTEGIQA